jgi:hypothetical protein
VSADLSRLDGKVASDYVTGQVVRVDGGRLAS